MVYKIKKLIVHFLQFKRAFVNYPFRKFNFVEILLIYIRERMTRIQFLILSGILVGLSAGLAGVLLKVLVHKIQFFINNDVPFEERMYVFAIFPLLGIVLTSLIVKYLFKGDEDKELSFILKDISKNGSKVKSSKMYSQIIQSAVTVGFGGSVGLETPIAVTGSAIGSNYAQRYSLGFKERTLLLASGAAAGRAHGPGGLQHRCPGRAHPVAAAGLRPQSGRDPGDAGHPAGSGGRLDLPGGGEQRVRLALGALGGADRK